MFRMIVVATALFAHGRLASAQPAGAQAEVLFKRGKELLAKGQISDACGAFDASQKLDPTDATLLNQAACRERNNQLATAYGLFLEAKRNTSARTDAKSKAMNTTAAEHAAKLEARLSTLTIRVPEDARVGGLELLRDRDVVDQVMWNQALPLDGGTYRIVARAPGNTEWSTTITLGNERDSKTIEIPRLRQAVLEPTAEPVAKPVAPTEVVAPPPMIEPGPSPVVTPKRSSAPYLVGASGLALLGAGLFVELHARSTFDKTKTELDVQEQLSHWESANKQRHVAQGLAIAGVAAAGIATYLFIRERRARPTMTASVGRSSAGFVIVGGF